MSLVRVIRYSHFISLHVTDKSVIKEIRSWAYRNCVQWERDYDRKLKKMVSRVGKRFYISRLGDTQWHFHINQQEEILSHLERLQFDVVVSEAPLYPVDKPNYVYSDVKTPREEQPKVIEFIKQPRTIRQVSLQTGKGKTFCSLYSIAALKEKTMLITRPGYFERWKGDICKSLGISWERVLYIVGNDELVDAIQLAKTGKLDCDFVCIGYNTLQTFIKDCMESNSHVGKYGIEWHQLFEVFNIGIRLIDEVHEWFHFNYLLDLLTNCPKGLSLSATMKPKDPFLDRMYRIAYPIKERYIGAYDKYIAVTSVIYQMREPWLIKSGKIKTRGPKGYSHMAFEASILKSQDFKSRYFKMINQYIQRFIKVEDDGKEVIEFDTGKMMIFVATSNMAKELKKYLLEHNPGIDTYTYLRSKMKQKEKDEWVWKPGICISTLGSAGTAVDIPDLVVTVQLHSIDSDQASEQALGRTRKPEERDYVPKFILFSCSDIGAQMKYEERKQTMFRGKVKSHSRQHIGCQL